VVRISHFDNAFSSWAIPFRLVAGRSILLGDLCDDAAQRCCNLKPIRGGYTILPVVLPMTKRPHGESSASPPDEACDQHNRPDATTTEPEATVDLTSGHVGQVPSGPSTGRVKSPPGQHLSTAETTRSDGQLPPRKNEVGLDATVDSSSDLPARHAAENRGSLHHRF
jgi:hypothetical protein